MHMCSNFSHYMSYILISRQIPFVAHHAADISALEKTEWNGQARSARDDLSPFLKNTGQILSCAKN